MTKVRPIKIHPLLTTLFKQDNKNVDFHSHFQKKGRRLENDFIFFIFFLIIPYALSFTSTLFPLGDLAVKFIIVTIIKGTCYFVGYNLIRKEKRYQLSQNGGSIFFLTVILIDFVFPFIIIALQSSTLSPSVVRTIQIIVYDILRMFVVFFMLIKVKSVRKDILYALFKKTPFIIVLVLFFYFLLISGNPVFNALNNIIAGGTTSTNQTSLDSVLVEKDFTAYWLVITIIVIAPIFEEFVYRHSLMQIQETKFMKFFVPFLYFLMIHVTSTISNDISHFFLYFWGSLLLTSLYYIKRNLAYPIAFHGFINQLTLL